MRTGLSREGEGQGLCPWTPLGPRAPDRDLLRRAPHDARAFSFHCLFGCDSPAHAPDLHPARLPRRRPRHRVLGLAGAVRAGAARHRRCRARPAAADAGRGLDRGDAGGRAAGAADRLPPGDPGGGALLCADLPLLAAVPGVPAMAGCLALFGAALGALDVAMNVQAVRVEDEAGRPLMSGFHGLYSAGGILGALGMGGLLALGAGPLAAACCLAAGCLGLLLAAAPSLPPGGGAGAADAEAGAAARAGAADRAAVRRELPGRGRHGRLERAAAAALVRARPGLVRGWVCGVLRHHDAGPAGRRPAGAAAGRPRGAGRRRPAVLGGAAGRGRGRRLAGVAGRVRAGRGGGGEPGAAADRRRRAPARVAAGVRRRRGRHAGLCRHPGRARG